MLNPKIFPKSDVNKNKFNMLINMSLDYVLFNTRHFY